MDSNRREVMLSQRSRLTNFRAKQQNRAEQRLLVLRVQDMRHNWVHTDSILDKEMKHISENLYEKDIGIAWGQEPVESRILLARIPSRSVSLTQGRCSTPQVCWKPKEKKPYYPRCRFSDGVRCAFFPCITPSSYTKLGFVEETKTGRLVVKAPVPYDAPAREQFLLQLENISPRRPLQSGRDVVASRERALKVNMEQLRLKNEVNKPIDWNVNYGAPMSLRRIQSVSKPRPYTALF